MTKVLAAAAAAGLTLALVPPSMAAGRNAATLQVRPQVAGLQVALRAWGLYAGPIDAIDGPGTRAAVRAFQQQAGLPVDGVAGGRTRAALGPLGRPLRSRQVLQRGAFGWDVSVLQFALTRAGTYRWPIDGFFGPETAAALQRYQQAKGLVADGVAGPETLVGPRSPRPGDSACDAATRREVRRAPGRLADRDRRPASACRCLRSPARTGWTRPACC